MLKNINFFLVFFILLDNIGVKMYWVKC